MSDTEHSSRAGRNVRRLDGGTSSPAKAGATRELPPSKRRHFVPRDELLAAFEGAPSIDYEQFRADIDAYVDQDPTPRYLVE